MKEYVIIDRNGELVAEPFSSERKAYQAMRVYEDNCTDVTLPMKVITKSEFDDGMRALADAHQAAQDQY